MGSFAFDTPFRFYFFALFFCILMTFFAKSLARSGIGRAFVAIRDNDLAAEAIGVNIFRYKVLAFAICSAYASVSAVLYVSFTGYTNPELFTFQDTVWYFGMAMIGGFGTTVGPIFGTILISLLRQMVVRAGPAMAAALPFMKVGSQSGILIMVFGIVLALFLIFEPRGIAHRWEILKNQGRLWPFAY
ncbi:MAG: branched-chain amino acid ABC transporter permease [Chloroflexota bacterium]